MKKTTAKLLLSTLLFISSPVAFSQAVPATEKTATVNEKTADTGFLNALMRRPDSLYFDSKDELLSRLKELNIISGYVYFSGTGFSQVQATAVHGSLFVLGELFNRCGPGSRITLDRCIFLKKDGSRTPLIGKSLFIR